MKQFNWKRWFQIPNKQQLMVTIVHRFSLIPMEKRVWSMIIIGIDDYPLNLSKMKDETGYFYFSFFFGSQNKNWQLRQGEQRKRWKKNNTKLKKD